MTPDCFQGLLPGSFLLRNPFLFFCSFSLLPTRGSDAGVGRAFSRVCLSVCPRSKMKTDRAINTKLGTRILYSSRLACIDPEVKRSKVTRLRKRRYCTVASDHVPYSAYQYATVLPEAVAGVGLHVNTTAYVFYIFFVFGTAR